MELVTIKQWYKVIKLKGGNCSDEYNNQLLIMSAIYGEMILW